MLRALWFFMKIGILLALIIWLAERPGTIEMEWQGYIIDMSVGFAAAILFLILLAFGVLYHLWRRFIALPKVWRQYNQKKRQTRGYEAITKGMLALASGDKNACTHHAKRANDLLPDVPLTKLIQAQAALLRGDNITAREYFRNLLDTKDGFFFGVRGLLTQSLQQNHMGEALDLARQAYRKEPNRSWILMTLFDLEVRHQNWEQAQEVLLRAMKKNAFDKYTGKKHLAVLFLAQADQALSKKDIKKARSFADKAQKTFPNFVPIALRRASIYYTLGKNRTAKKILQDVWDASPHPDILDLWESFLDNTMLPVAKMNAVKDFIKEQSNHLESSIALAKAALDAEMWGIARDNLAKALQNQPDVRVYRLLARLEREGLSDPSAANEWMDKASLAKKEPRWQCINTGAVFEEWKPISPADGSFNTLEWRIPSSGGQHALNRPHALIDDSYESFPIPGNTKIVTL